MSMKIKEPINADGTIDIFGDDGRIAVTVHPTELTEKGMADAVVLAERIVSMPSGNNQFLELIQSDDKIPNNYHLLEILHAAYGPLNDRKYIEVDGNSLPKTANGNIAESVTLGFYCKGIKYTNVLIAWPEAVIPCEHDHDPATCVMCQLAHDQAEVEKRESQAGVR